MPMHRDRRGLALAKGARRAAVARRRLLAASRCLRGLPARDCATLLASSLLRRSRPCGYDTWSVLQAPAGLEDPGHHAEAKQQEKQGHAQAHADADIPLAEEAPAEAADQIDDRVEQADRLPGLGQHRDRIKGAAEKGQRRDQQGRHEGELFEALGPDADDEAEQAEGQAGQHQERQHDERMLDMERHEKGGGCEDDQAEHDRLGRRRADKADHHLHRGDGCRKQLVDRAGEFGEINAHRGIGDALRQQREHDQPRNDEAAIADPVDLLHARSDRPAEHHEIERGGDHGRDQALPQGPQRARHFEAIDRPDAMGVDRGRAHAAAPTRRRSTGPGSTRPTKMSSSELFDVSRSLKPI